MWKLSESGRLSGAAVMGVGRSASGPRVLGVGGLLILLLAACGCPMSVDPPGGGDDVPFLDKGTNSTFNTATALPISAAGELEFEGQIATVGDLDIYDLGTLSPGDGLLIDVQHVASNLDLVAAVFDDREHLEAYNDDREPDSSDLEPLLDFVVRGETGRYYLGITPYFESTATGVYRVTVRITRAAGLPEPEAQIVFLDWDGGQNVVVPNVGVFDLEPFDAEDLGPYAGRTEEMKDLIQAHVASRFEDYQLVLRNSDDHAVPVGPHTTVYFGGDNARAFAISEQIDTLNADAADDAIVFTESYRGAFLYTPTVEQMAVAVGNTAAHEIGHLLGLVHTHDCESLMDASCSNQSILTAQEFKLAELDNSVFPVGWQEANEILEWVLGFVGL